MNSDTAAIILAAGKGRRMGGTNKALMPLNGQPVLSYSVNAFRKSTAIGEIIVVMNSYDLTRLKQEWGRGPEELGIDKVVDGGEERWLSSLNGLLATHQKQSFIMVHDAARPLITTKGIEKILSEAKEAGAAIAAEPVMDTLKRSSASTKVTSTLNRQGIWKAQTPQAAKRDLLLAAFNSWDAKAKGNPTDESMLLENYGHTPQLVPLNTPNFKLTTSKDLHVAEALLKT